MWTNRIIAKRIASDVTDDFCSLISYSYLECRIEQALDKVKAAGLATIAKRDAEIARLRRRLKMAKAPEVIPPFH